MANNFDVENSFTIFVLVLKELLLSEILKRLFDNPLVKHVAGTFDLALDIPTPREDHLFHVLLGDGKGFTVLNCKVNKLTFPLVDNVVVTNELLTLLPSPDLVK